MNVTKIAAIAIMTMLMFSSCAPKLTPFTEGLYNANRWSETELKKIQFYLSDDVVIRRQHKESNSAIVAGEIKMVDGRQVEEIFIPKGTPGVMSFMKDGKKEIAISFEAGFDDRYLMFGANPKQAGRYALMASDWKNKIGKVTYAGQTYRTEPGDGYSCLMVNLKKINKTDVNSRKVTGHKVD